MVGKSKLDAATKRRVRAGRLLLAGKTPPEVARAVGAPRQTVYRWRDVLIAAGIDALRDMSKGGRPARLGAAELSRLYVPLLEGPELHGFDCFGHGRVASHHHHLAVWHQLARKGQDLHPVKFIHHQVRDNHVIGVLLEHPFAFGTAGRHGASVASSFQAFGHCPCVSRIVIDNQERE